MLCGWRLRERCNEPPRGGRLSVSEAGLCGAGTVRTRSRNHPHSNRRHSCPPLERGHRPQRSPLQRTRRWPSWRVARNGGTRPRWRPSAESCRTCDCRWCRRTRIRACHSLLDRLRRFYSRGCRGSNRVSLCLTHLAVVGAAAAHRDAGDWASALGAYAVAATGHSQAL